MQETMQEGRRKGGYKIISTSLWRLLWKQVGGAEERDREREGERAAEYRSQKLCK